MNRMSYKIRFEGIGSTSVFARSSREAIEFGQMFERFGKTDIVIQGFDGADVPLSKFRELNHG
jgi:hypothetical protein